MRPEKAARISSYLAKNSARISVMNRKREDVTDYYVKSKYAKYALSEEMPQREKRRMRLDAHAQPSKKRNNLLSGNGKGRFNIMSLGIVVIIIFLAMVLIK